MQIPGPSNSLPINPEPDDKKFSEFRRKVREAEVLSSSMARLLQALNFTGRISVIVQNGRVLKSGYEEGYFSRRWDDRLV